MCQSYSFTQNCLHFWDFFKEEESINTYTFLVISFSNQYYSLFQLLWYLSSNCLALLTLYRLSCCDFSIHLIYSVFKNSIFVAIHFLVDFKFKQYFQLPFFSTSQEPHHDRLYNYIYVAFLYIFYFKVCVYLICKKCPM